MSRTSGACYDIARGWRAVFCGGSFQHISPTTAGSTPDGSADFERSLSRRYLVQWRTGDKVCEVATESGVKGVGWWYQMDKMAHGRYQHLFLVRTTFRDRILRKIMFNGTQWRCEGGPYVL